MKTTMKKVIKYTSIIDYKTLEVYLEKMASKGYLLTELKNSVLIFKKITPRKLKFNVSLFYHTTPFDYPNKKLDKEYRELCEESGWKYCASNQIYQIFYTEKNGSITPIHTDSKVEYNIIKKIFMKTEFVGLILLFFIMCMGLYNLVSFKYDDLYSNISLFSVVSPIILLINIILMYSYPVTWLIKNKINTNKGYEIKFPSYRNSVFRTVTTWTLIIFYLVVLLFAIISCLEIKYILFMLLIVVIPFFIFVMCFRRFKKVKKTRSHNIIVSLIILLCVWLLIIILSFIYISHSVSNYDSVNKIPAKYKVLKLTDFVNKGEIVSNRWREKSSILVPQYYKYYERTNHQNELDIYSLTTTYIKTLNIDIANYIYESYIKYEARNKSIVNEQDVNKWKVDKVFYITHDKDEVILLNKNIIYILKGNLDFSDENIINIVKEKLAI